ncbi:DUF3927 family protein, partial [Escherichia coli]
MTVKLRLAAVGLLLFLVVMVDFTGRIMSVLADGVLVAGEGNDMLMSFFLQTDTTNLNAMHHRKP